MKRSTWFWSVYVGVFMASGLWTHLGYVSHRTLDDSLLEDYRIYVRAFDEAREGRGPYRQQPLGEEFVYPPPALPLLGSVVRLVPAGTWQAPTLISANLLLLGGSIALVARYSGGIVERWWWFPVGFGFAPVLDTIHLGQVNIACAAGLAVFIVWLRRRPIAAGVGLAIPTALKITPILVAVAALVDRRWRTLMALGATLFGLTALALIGWGPRILADYWEVATRLSSESVFGLASHSWVSLFSDPSGADRAQVLVRVISMAAVLASGLIGARTRTPLSTTVVMILVAVLSQNLLWYHHYTLWLIPLLAFSAHRGVAWNAWIFGGLLVIQLDRIAFTHGSLIHVWGQITVAAVLIHQLTTARSTTDQVERAPSA